MRTSKPPFNQKFRVVFVILIHVSVKKNLVITQQNAFYKKYTLSQEQLWNCEKIFQNVSLIYSGFLRKKTTPLQSLKKRVSKSNRCQNTCGFTTNITFVAGEGGG